MVSDKDIRDVARNAELTRAELENLYSVLEITQPDIENQQGIADTRDFMLQAVRVLKHWRQKNGKDATRQKVLDALHECEYKRSKELLEEIWKLTDKR